MVANNSNHGIYCVGSSHNVTYVSNHFYNTENTTIRDNTFEKGGVILPTLTIAQFNNVTLSNNSINGLPIYFSTGEADSVINPGYGQVIISDGYNLTIQSQNSSYTAIGISIHHSQKITIKENLCQNNTQHGINLLDVSNVELIKNTCKFNKWDGIRISGGDYLLITRNNCTQNGFRGMDLASVENTIVTENILHRNLGGGIEVYYPKSSQIMKNDVGENFDHGIEIGAESLSDDSITVAYNDIYNNSQSGIFLDKLTRADVMNNQIRNNKYLGIQVRGTTELHAHHNAFVNNEYSIWYPSQALVYEEFWAINPQIYWYDIITGEGNYWSDLNNASYYWIPGDDPHYDPNPLQQNPFETIIHSTPDAPRNLIATLNGLTVQLTWEKPLENGGAPIEYYNIYRGRNTEEYSYLGITRTTTFLDEQGTAGETYYYMVAAVNSIGIGEFSEVVMQNYPKNPVTTTQSITSSHESTEDSTNASPGFIFPVIFLSCALCVLLRRRK
jgi:parallel beta-helix repeat protein